MGIQVCSNKKTLKDIYVYMGFNTIYIGYLQFVKYTFLRLGQYQLRIRIICKISIKYTYSKSSSLYISTFLQTIRI